MGHLPYSGQPEKQTIMFGVSLDALILGHDQRVVEELGRTSKVKPSYQNVHDWEFYASNLHTEYTQSIEEGLAIEAYKDVFSAVSRLPQGEIKKKMGDVLFEVVSSAKPKEAQTSNCQHPLDH